MATKQKTSHWGKSRRIARRIRARIVQGEWQPGQRLPTRVELKDEFQTTAATIQKALDELRDEEIVIPRGSRGTFVNEQPPFRCRIGVVYPTDPGHPETWRRMYAAVDAEAQRLIHENRYDLQCYYGVEDPDSEGYRELLTDVAANRLAGIYACGMSLDLFEDTELLNHPYLRIAASKTQGVANGLPVVSESVIKTAVPWLAAQDCRRMAMIYSHQMPDMPAALQQEAARHGLACRLNWCVPAWPTTPQAARTGAYLLMRQPANERPDAIIVSDDYLAEQTTLGVVDAGCRPPEDVQILVQCNFPYAPPAVAPITKLGVDWPRLLKQTIDALLASEMPADVVVPMLTDEAWQARLALPRTSVPSPAAIPV